jgi:uncharacterized membrane protein YkoI
MTCSREEIEKAISELKEGDLYIAKEIGMRLCTFECNMFLSTRKGEEIKTYIELLSKLKAASEDIAASQTVEGIFEIIDRFDDELADYIKAEKVKTATEAMEIAHSFIKKYIPIALPMKAVREEDVWNVDIDVGALAVKVAKVKVDAKTGDILSYGIPEK